MELKTTLHRLSKRNVAEEVVTCVKICDDVLQKVRHEKKELETKLESKDNDNLRLKSHLEFYRSSIKLRGINPM